MNVLRGIATDRAKSNRRSHRTNHRIAALDGPIPRNGVRAYMRLLGSIDAYVYQLGYVLTSKCGRGQIQWYRLRQVVCGLVRYLTFATTFQ